MITSILVLHTAQLGQNFLATLVLANLTLLLTYLSTFKVTGKGKKVVCGKGSEDEIGSWMISWCFEIIKKCKDQFHSIFLKSYHGIAHSSLIRG